MFGPPKGPSEKEKEAHMPISKPVAMAFAVVLSALMLPLISIAEQAHADVTIPAVNYQQQTEHLALAQADPQAFLELALKNYHRRVRDYTCLFVKQELVQGKLTKQQHIQVKFREAPFSVFMQWVRNPGLVGRVLYVKGKYGNNALVKPAGWLRLLVPTHVKRPINSPDSAKVSRKRLDQFGFANMLKIILKVNNRAAKAGDLRFEYKRQAKLNGRETFVFERFLPDKPQYADRHLVIHIDQQWLVPIATYCYGPRERLLGKYELRNVKINPGLSWKEFTPKANGL